MADAPSLVLTVPTNPSVTFHTVTAGVYSINDTQGYIRLSGAGLVNLSQDGKMFIISGMLPPQGSNTGAVTQADLAASGAYFNLRIDSLSGWAASAQSLYQTGSTLFNLINASNAGVISVNGASGVLNLTGAGTVTVSRAGQLITISGLVSGGGGDVTFSQLAASGAYLEGLITGASGYSALTYATKAQLTSSGVSLGATIASTGQTAWTHGQNNATNLSGALTQTGVLLGNRIDSVVSNLTATGVSLGAKIDALSGNAASAANLAATGSVLDSKINSLSGYDASTYATIVALASTGQQAWTHSDNNARNLSGNLTQTGVLLGSRIDTVASNLAATGTTAIGYTNTVSGGLQTQIQATGQTAWTHSDNNARNLSGNLTQTGIALIALIGAASAGVSSLNGSSGVMTIGGAGNVVVSTVGQTITVSGNTGAYAGFASKLELASTGQTLDTKINSSSGYAEGQYYPKSNPSGYISGDFYTKDEINQALIFQDPFYFNSQNAEISGFKIFIRELPTDLNPVTGTITVTTTNQYITGFISTSGYLAYNGTLAGLHGLSILANKTSASSRDTELYYRLSLYNGVTFTPIVTSATTNFLTTSLSRYNFSTLLTGLNITETDRLLVDFYATRGASGPDAVVNLVFAGDTAARHSLPANFDILKTTYYPLSNPSSYATSGNLTATGQLLSAVRVTGSSILNNVNLTGLGGTLVIQSGDYVFISGAAQGGAGDVTSSQLTSTGQTLGAKIDSLSGYSDATFATKVQLTNTGSQLYSFASSISGNLTQTGVTLGSQISTVSTNTAANANNLSGRLAATGSQLYSMAAAISGNLTATGVALGSQISTVSANTLANASNLSGRLQATGSQLYNFSAAISGNLTATGVSLGSRIDTVASNTQANAVNLSGALTASGQRLSAVTVTGSSIVNSPDLVGINGVTVTRSGLNQVVFSGNSDQLTQTGSILISLISAASAGVASLNGASGTLTIAGAGNVSVTTVGQTITVSGNTGAYASFATKVDLASTGSHLYSMASAISGNLIVTGASLGSRIDTAEANSAANAVNLSGRLTATGQLLSAVTVTGSSVLNNPNFSGIGGTNVIQSGNFVLISGGAGVGTVTASQLEATGQAAWTHGQNNALNLSGNLTQTGVLLGGRIDTLTSNVAANATNLSGNLAATGSQLYSMASAISGNLTATGVALGSQISTVSANTTANANNLSGRLQTTGSQLYNFAAAISGNLIATGVSLGSRIDTVATNTQANAVNLSGNLTQTGVLLGSRIDTVAANTAANAANLSGTLTATGQRLSALTVTGSSIVNSPDISGFNGVTVLRSGLNQILFSGNSDQLTQTGAILISLISAASAGVASINGASGTMTINGAGNVSVITNGQTITVSGDTGVYALFASKADLAATGTQLYSMASAISGNLTQTGVSLGSSISTVAANGTANAVNLSGRLAATGSQLYSFASSISGNLTATGVALGSRIDTLTTNSNANALNISGRLAATGTQLYSMAAAISGNLTQTGVALGSRIDTLTSNLTSTGVTLGAKIDSLSGNLVNYVPTGTILSYTTGIITGFDMVYINHLNHVFSTPPRVVVELELTSSHYTYAHSISGRSTTGFYLHFSDIIEESGIFANVIAKS